MKRRETGAGFLLILLTICILVVARDFWQEAPTLLSVTLQRITDGLPKQFAAPTTTESLARVTGIAAAERSETEIRAQQRLEQFHEELGTDSSRAIDPVKEAIDHLKAIRKCERLSGRLGEQAVNPSGGLNLNGCPVDSERARDSASGYQDLLADQTIDELAFLRLLAIEAEHDGRAAGFTIQEVARTYVQHHDDNVKEQALELARLLPPSRGRVEAGAAALQNTVSGPLAVLALDVMQNSRDQAPEVVDHAIREALSHGGWDVRDAVAEHLLPFITVRNREALLGLQKKAAPRSKLALNLRLNIEEFDRLDQL